MKTKPERMTVAEVAAYIGVAPRTVQAWIQSPEDAPEDFPTARTISERIRSFSRREIESWLADRDGEV